MRIRVLVTSTAFTDVMIRKGHYPDVKEKPPFTSGHDLVDAVDAVDVQVRLRARPGIADRAKRVTESEVVAKAIRARCRIA